MKASSQVANQQVKREITKSFKLFMNRLIDSAENEADLRSLEEVTWDAVLEIGQSLTAMVLNIRCRKATEKDMAKRGLSKQQTKLRNEPDYWYQLMTTFGPVQFFSYAYRDMSAPVGSVTRVPAREAVLPLYAKTRSSELCLEWETRLGSEHSFRKAQEALTFFTHSAVRLEDTTIARHMVTTARLIDPDWLYRDPAEIRTILEMRATRDSRTGQPIIYMSTDAHALRRYVDETWDAQWKMANGIRLWCVDRNNGAIIHLGGEYTWGDCEAVSVIVDRLVTSGHLAEDGDYGNGTSAKLVVITDGAPWIENHVLPLLPWAVPILDAYHTLEHIGNYVALRFGKASREARYFYDQAACHLLGKTVRSRKKSKKRKNHRKHLRRKTRSAEAIQACEKDELKTRRMTGPEKVLEMLILDEPTTKKQRKSREALVNFVEGNWYRMDYLLYRNHGYQIGSGAMESLHRTASQVRLKIPGGRWLEETSQAIFDLRMMAMVGKWDAFWHQPGLTSKLVMVFGGETSGPQNRLQEAA